MDAKLENLIRILAESDRLLVAFSAGVDSTFLLKAANLALGARAIALTASSPSVPAGDLDDADRKSTRLNSSHIQKSRMPSSA